MINREWNPWEEPVVYQPLSGLNLETLRFQSVAIYVVICPQAGRALLSLFGSCLFSLALMIRFAPLQL